LCPRPSQHAGGAGSHRTSGNPDRRRPSAGTAWPCAGDTGQPPALVGSAAAVAAVVARWALGFSAEHAEPSTLNAQLYYPPNPEPSTILNLPCIITPARPALLSCPASLNLLCVKESHVCCNHAPHRHPQKPACHVAG